MSNPGPARQELDILEDQLERSFRGGAWHGPAVLEALDGVDAAVAVQRPIAQAHSIGEIVLHLAAWIDVTRRRIEGEAVHDLPEMEDWPACECPNRSAWQLARERLEEAHSTLQRTLRGLDDCCLGDPVAGSDPTVRGSLLGILQHNVYHAGQIVLLKKAIHGAPR